MYQPDLNTWAFLLAAGLWLTAGLTMLTSAVRQHSSPDYLLALSLLAGGLLLGVDGAPIAGQGPFSLGAIALLAACFWSFGGRQVDEATGLQPGDQWIKALGMTGIAAVLHLVAAQFGSQPVFYLGLTLRPFELLVTGTLLYLWWCSRRLPEDFYACIRRRDLASLLWAVAGASLARFLGAANGDLFACALLALGILPYLSRCIPKQGNGVAVRGAIAAAAMLAFLGLTRGHHLREQQSAVQRAQQAWVQLTRDYETLQHPLDEAVEQRVSEETRTRYAERLIASRASAATLRLATRRVPRDFHDGFEYLEKALLDHERWAEQTLAAVDAWRGVTSNVQERQRQEEQARSARREAWMVHDRGREALSAIHGELVGAGVGLVEDTGAMQRVVLALLAALGLLCAAMLPTQRMGRGAAKLDLPPYREPWEDAEKEHETASSEPVGPACRGRALVVDPDPKHRCVLRGMLEPIGVEVNEADGEEQALELLSRGGFDLVLLDAHTPEFDVARATAVLRERGDDTPVVAMAAGADEQVLRAAGCDEVVGRHAAPEELEWTLDRFLIPGDGRADGGSE